MSDDSHVIVAIPNEDDPIWKTSSEKIPHLTLLYLNNNISNLTRVTDYIQHVVDTTMTRFGLSVDRRGTLGPENADVLFFQDYCVKPLEVFRNNLLKNRDIRDAYNSIPQYSVWTPHLTLGYPATPAKESDSEYPITWIRFDKIALWTGDYQGVDFLLPSDDRYSLEMSDIKASISPADILSHHGVLGMHWGKRKARAEAPRATNYSPGQQSYDRFNFGKRGSDRINERLSKGSDIEAARKAELTYRKRRALLILGATYAALLIAKHGPLLLQSIANNYVGKKAAQAAAQAAASVLSESHGIGNHKIVDLGYDAVTGLWK